MKALKALVTVAAGLALAAPVAPPVAASDEGAIIRIDSRGKGKHKGKKWRRGDDRAYHQGYHDGRRDAEFYRPGGYVQHQRWSRGQVMPYEYRRYVVREYHEYGWAPPPPGYAYYRTDTGDVLLAQIATGVILSVLGR